MCQHPNKAEIHQMYLTTFSPTKKESWRAFLDVVSESYPDFGVSRGTTAFQRHFRGSTVKGKVRLPHFSVGAIGSGNGKMITQVVNETINQISDRVEKKGLMVAERVIDEIADGTRPVKNTEAINLLGKIVSSRAAKDALEMKRRELDSKNKRFDKALLAALYGTPDKIKDAILVPDDNDGNAQELLGRGEAGVLEEHNQGENG